MNANREIQQIQSILVDPKMPEHIKARLRRSLKVDVICISLDIQEWRRESAAQSEAAAETHRNFDWGWRA